MQGTKGHNIAATAKGRLATGAWMEIGPDRRMRIDLEAILDPERGADENSPFFETWSRLRRSVGLNLGPREQHRPFNAGLLRNEIENHALAMRSRFDVTEILDVRYVDALAEMVSTPPVTPVRLSCRWGSKRDPKISPRWHRRLLSRIVDFGSRRQSSRPELPSVLGGAFGSRSAKASSPDEDSVRVGPGWIETGSGRRRPRSDFVTMVLGQVDRDPRIEVRLTSVERSIRLRFDAVSDQRLRLFWTRWNAS